MMLFFFILLIDFIQAQCNFAAGKPITIPDLKKCFNLIKYDPDEAKITIDIIKEYYNSYSFRDTSLNTPGPPIGYGTHSMDLYKELDMLTKRNYDSMPHFYSEVSFIINKLKDPHTAFDSSCLDSIYYYQPLNFYMLSKDIEDPNDCTVYVSLPNKDDDYDDKELVFINLEGYVKFDSVQDRACQRIFNWSEVNQGISRNPSARFTQTIKQDFQIRSAQRFRIPPDEFTIWYIDDDGALVMKRLPYIAIPIKTISSPDDICQKVARENISENQQMRKKQQEKQNQFKHGNKDKKVDKMKIIQEIQRIKQRIHERYEMKMKPKQFLNSKKMKKIFENNKMNLKEQVKEKTNNLMKYNLTDKQLFPTISSPSHYRNSNTDDFEQFCNITSEYDDEQIFAEGLFINSESIGILRIHSFMPDNISQFYKAIFEIVDQFAGGEGRNYSDLNDKLNDDYICKNITEKGRYKANKLYIDLRSNGGGIVNLGRHVQQFIFPQSIYPLYFGMDQVKNNLNEQISKLFQYLAELVPEQIDLFVDPETLEIMKDWYTKKGVSRKTTEKQINNALSNNSNSITVTLTQKYAMYAEHINFFRQLQQKWVYENKTLFKPQQTYLISDGLCGSTCAQFAKHVGMSHFARTYAVGVAPGEQHRFDIASFAAGSVESSETIELYKQEAELDQIINKKYLPPPFPRSNTYVTWSHQEAYGITQQTKDQLQEYYIVDPDIWEKQFIISDDDPDRSFDRLMYYKINAQFKEKYGDFGSENEKCIYWEIKQVQKGGECKEQELADPHAVFGHPCVVDEEEFKKDKSTPGTYDTSSCVIESCDNGYYLKEPASKKKQQTCQPWPQGAFLYPGDPLPHQKKKSSNWVIILIIVVATVAVLTTGIIFIYLFIKKKACFKTRPSRSYSAGRKGKLPLASTDTLTYYS